MTREQIQNLKEGELVQWTTHTRNSQPLPGARWSRPLEVTRIYARGTNPKGHAYVCFYVKLGETSQMSMSDNEGDDRVRRVNPAKGA